MEGKSQSKLTRTPSSLFHSSIDDDSDKPKTVKPRRTAAFLLLPIAAVAATTTSLIVFLRDDYPPTSLNLLLLLLPVLAAAALFAKRGRSVWDESRRRGKSVEWFIGSEGEPAAAAVGEGVEVYGNGDFYEGEFENGKCNGSGVYNYFLNGRYEGDWVDGRYDGYGIESWAKGSRYRGQYRRGVRRLPVLRRRWLLRRVAPRAEPWVGRAELLRWELLCWGVYVWGEAWDWLLQVQVKNFVHTI